MAVVLSCAEASAQTTTGTAVVTVAAKVERRDGRPKGLDEKTINYDDCVADDSLKVTIGVMGGSPGLEVWAGLTGTDCANTTYRTTNGSSCWKVGGLTTAVDTTMELKVRDLLKHDAGVTGQAICDNLAKDSATGFGTLKVDFVLTKGTDSGGTGATIAVIFDLVGPDAPTGLAITAGDTRLFPEWDSATATEDTEGYYLYCEETTSVEACEGTLLVPGEPVPNDASLKSGRTATTSTRGEVEGLTNYTAYACAVAGYDSKSNTGVLSELICDMPQPVNGYFKTFRAAGGTAGGGYCSFGRAAAIPGTAALSLAALGGLFVRRLRRRKAQASARG